MPDRSPRHPALRRVALSLLALGTVLMVAPTDLSAQSRPTRRDATACSMRAPLLSIVLRDSTTESAIEGARVRLLLAEGALPPLFVGRRVGATPGEWTFFSEADVPLPEVTNGLAVVLEVERTGRPTIRRSVLIGLDERGCHPIIRGDRTIRI